MSLEPGGRADKGGNHYEDLHFTKLLLDLIQEQISSIKVEPLGIEGEGIEYVVTANNGEHQYYQCKSSNGTAVKWRPCDLEGHRVFKTAKAHILRGENNVYCFISPVPYDELDSLCDRARTCGSASNFPCQITNSSLRNWFAVSESKFGCKGEQLINILSRCYFELMPKGEEMRRDIESRIDLLFVSRLPKDVESIRILLGEYANDACRWDKPIIAFDVIRWLEEKGYRQRSLRQDRRCLTHIQELNRIYKDRFQPINGVLFHRQETDQLLAQIEEGKSVILEGNAGFGKSGCIQELLERLTRSDIPYLALSLDRDKPERSPDQFGISLGFSDSPVATLHRVSSGRICALIFDQLDALRWTNYRTSTMLDVCKGMLRQVLHFNQWENGKICCVFVVRTIDRETDPGLQKLLSNHSEISTSGFQWETVKIGILLEEEVQKIAGEAYTLFSPRLRNLLRTPSALYVWTLIKDMSRNTIQTLRQLMDMWWREILEYCEGNGLESERLNRCRREIVSHMRKNEELSVPILLIQDKKAAVALISCGMLAEVNESVCFVHQSFLDFFLVEDYLQKLYSGQEITELFCDRDRQTPDVRYQFLMLLQYLLEVDKKRFLQECRHILRSENIRWYFQCCVFEVMGQLSEPSEDAWEFVEEFFDCPEWHDKILQNVFYRHPAFVRLLHKKRPSYAWNESEGCRMLGLIVDQTPAFVWMVLQEQGLSTIPAEELCNILLNCTTEPPDVVTSTIVERLTDTGDMLNEECIFHHFVKKEFSFVILLLKKWIETGLDRRKQLYFYKGEAWQSFNQRYAPSIIDELLPAALNASIVETESPYRTPWSSRNINSSEHEIVQMIQASLNQVAEDDPDKLIRVITQWNSSASPIRAELFLHAVECMPVKYTDYALSWVLEDIDRNAFDQTSSEKNQLSCCQRILEKFSSECSNYIFSHLEQTICRWNPPKERMRRIYQHYMDTRRTEGGGSCYGSFWGEFQRILLPALDSSRISEYTRQLISVLNRKFPTEPTCYNLRHFGIAHFISSPIDSRLCKISDKSWLRIVVDMSQQPDKSRHFNGVYIEASPFTFAQSLSAAAKKDPVRFASLSLRFPPDTLENFVNAVLDHALISSSVPLNLTCSVLRQFCENPSNEQAISIARIIEHRAEEQWPDDILECLLNIARSHPDPDRDCVPGYSIQEKGKISCHDLLQGAVNCARGYAVVAIEALLWEHPQWAEKFCDTVESMTEDPNPAVRYAAVSCAAVWYNIDKLFSKRLFLKLLEKDIRVLGAPQAWPLVARFWDDESNYFFEKLMLSAQSHIEDLQNSAADMLTVLVLMKSLPTDLLLNMPFTPTQTETVCRQAVDNFDDDRCHELCVQILQNILMRHDGKLHAIEALFYDNKIHIHRDKVFLESIIEVSDCHFTSRLIKYIKESEADISDYAEILVSIGKSLSSLSYWDIEAYVACIMRLFHSGRNNQEIKRACLDIWDTIFFTNPIAMRPLADLLDNV